ncbi:MAG: 1-phosphofructokinase family hexose kinase [Sphingobium sp.]|nr:1-phosphofructokinase family hexose kinase [Sphingobium sp.]
MSENIFTLTLNPAIDAYCTAEKIEPVIKIRTGPMRYDAGGGGINVAHVLNRLGSDVCACFLAGGLTGQLLENLLEEADLPMLSLPIAGSTRISQTVHERSSQQDFRFVPEGPMVQQREWQAALDSISISNFSILVASGSIAPGVPEDFYARLLRIMKAKGARMILDCTGPALAHAVREGGLWMIKPSIDEFEVLIGRPMAGPEEYIKEAHSLIETGAATIIAITMGSDGAILVHEGGALYRKAPAVEVVSTVGAGDSFVAGMTHRLAQGWMPERAFLYGMATGTAAVLTPGTEICRIEDVERLFSAIEAMA